MSRIAVEELNVDAELYALVKDEIAPDTGVECRGFLAGVGRDCKRSGSGESAFIGEGAMSCRRRSMPGTRGANLLIEKRTGLFCRRSGICCPKEIIFRC